MPDSIRLPLARARRRLCELAGISRYSRPALNGLDRKLERHLDFNGGFFVEAGANDGYLQSNTYYFERLRRWRGVLIEPIPELYEKCRKLRTRSKVVQSALVAPGHPQPTIEMQFAGLMSVTSDAFEDAHSRASHIEAAAGVGQVDDRGHFSLTVPAATLSQILDRVAPGVEIDLLSLDVEGAELVALAGLDLRRHSPRFICVEVRNMDRASVLLAATHEVVEILTDTPRYKDVLFRRK